MTYSSKDTATYFDQVAPQYDEEGTSYPANSYRFELVTEIAKKLPPSKILDAGCGTGRFLGFLLQADHTVAGCDLSPGMLNEAEKFLNSSEKKVPLYQTSLDNLSMFEDSSFDHVFSLGVFPYIPEGQEEKCYQEIRRVLKPGGLFVSAHENEIFDTFTFNKYTLRFFERNIYPLLQKLDSNLKLEDLKKNLASLITNPEKPVNRNASASARDLIFLKPENPLTYKEKIYPFGFSHEETLYYHFHALPPLLRSQSDALVEVSKKMEINLAKNWQGLFLASTFISVAKAI